jgi:hypothetical protein
LATSWEMRPQWDLVTGSATWAGEHPQNSKSNKLAPPNLIIEFDISFS